MVPGGSQDVPGRVYELKMVPRDTRGVLVKMVKIWFSGLG